MGEADLINRSLQESRTLRQALRLRAHEWVSVVGYPQSPGPHRMP
jgi:hypothetical protein